MSRLWSVCPIGSLIYARVTDAHVGMSPEDARAFAGAILDASVRAERAAKEAERG